MSLLFQDSRIREMRVDISLHVCELLRWVRRITFKDDFVVVASLYHLTEAKVLIDVTRSLLCELGQPLLEVWMEGAFIDQKTALESILSQSVLRNHSSDGVLQDVLSVTLQHVLHRCSLQVANVARVLPIQLLLLLATSHVLVGSVDDHNEVPIYAASIVDVGWLVLTAKESGGHARDTTKRHSCCIEQVPCLTFVLNCNIGALRFSIRFSPLECSVEKCVVEIIHSLTNVWIKLDARVLGLWLKRFVKDLHFLLHLNSFVNRVITFTPCKSRELHPLTSGIYIFWLLSGLS